MIYHRSQEMGHSQSVQIVLESGNSDKRKRATARAMLISKQISVSKHVTCLKTSHLLRTTSHAPTKASGSENSSCFGPSLIDVNIVKASGLNLNWAASKE
jgi:hypothetical protein